jgi:SAM-dependent methyltransferase
MGAARRVTHDVRLVPRLAVRTICSNPLLFYLFRPTKVSRLVRVLSSSSSPRILDLGCGNHSSLYFRTASPECYYVGVDRERPTLKEDLDAMNRFILADLQTSRLDDVANESFDVVVASHVLEHLAGGLSLLPLAVSKVRVGGYVYLAYPSARSVDFPSRPGTLNFYDDPTHVTVLRTDSVLHSLSELGIKVVSHGVGRSSRNLLLMGPKIMLSPILGGVSGPTLWDLYGFEEYVLGRKREVGEVG